MTQMGRCTPALRGVAGTGCTASLPVAGWKALKVLEHLGNFRKTSERQLTSRGACADALGSPMVGELLQTLDLLLLITEAGGS